MSRLISLFGVMLLATGCAITPPLVVKLYPPPDLLQDCPAPSYTMVLTGDLAKAILLERDALVNCNIDKASLRAWSVKE